MRIVAYNLHFGGHTRSANHWQKICDEFTPDLVLAQESFNPADYFPDGVFPDIERSVVWKALPSKWGSAILATQHDVNKIFIPAELAGWVAGGKIANFFIGGEARPLSIFSIHAPSPGPYEKNVNNILDWIQNIADDSEILIGGDFNITTAVRHSTEELKNTKSELAILDRLKKEFGLINSWQAANPNRSLPQTLRWTSNTDKPYHCDGIFIPISWLPYLESSEIVTEGWREMSDHNPIITTLKAQQGHKAERRELSRGRTV